MMLISYFIAFLVLPFVASQVCSNESETMAIFKELFKNFTSTVKNEISSLRTELFENFTSTVKNVETNLINEIALSTREVKKSLHDYNSKTVVTLAEVSYL